MPDGKKYRVAVIGRTGKGDYGHALDAVWLNHPRADLIAVADDNEAGRLAASKRLGVQATYADYRKMLATERPQVVSVAPRWLDAHRDMVVACAEHGASVFLEKPVARTLQEADERDLRVRRPGGRTLHDLQGEGRRERPLLARSARDERCHPTRLRRHPVRVPVRGPDLDAG